MSNSVVRTHQSGGFDFLTLENENLRAVFLPELGNKMVELRNLVTGKQFLLAPQRPYARPEYGDDFAAYDTSGFDECFPTVASSPYRSLAHPRQDYDVVFPDHGELWSRPWEIDDTAAELRSAIRGVRGAYDFEKRIIISENVLTFHYTLRNRSMEAFSYLWSAHPLLHVTPGAELLLPGEIKTVFLNWSSEPSIGRFGDHIEWPYILPGKRAVSFSTVQDPSLGIAVKCFTDPLNEGYAGIYDRESDESLLIEFDTRDNPYLGLWLCYGGWPQGAGRKHLTVALEPASGRPDSLEEAVRRKECQELRAGGERSWTLRLTLWKGRPPIDKRQ